MPAGFVPDPARGTILFDVVSCFFGQAPGVVVTSSSADAETNIWYARNLREPDLARTETDAAAGVAITNAPPGPFRIQARRRETDQLVADVTVFVQAGKITYFDLPPIPLP